MTSPRTLLAAWQIHAKKQLGQHFLEDIATSRMIVDRCKIAPEDIVLEIGAGLGALTIPVARIAKKVYAVEKDRQIIALLKTELIASNLLNVVIIENDVLRVSIEKFAEEANRKILVLGNLPYNISSQVLVKLIESRCVIPHAVLMFQKELAERITAGPGCRDYGRLSVMLGYCAEIETLAQMKSSQFYPRPEVDSTVLKIIFRNRFENRAESEEFLFRVIKAAFGKRRKTLRNSLAGTWPSVDAKKAGECLENVGIDPARRAETLSVSEFVKLSNRLAKAVNPHGKSNISP